ncbi:MAG TPA: winged helix-turn-helix domain-containing protein [Pyrinomonadaceae bacterium]|nr:winged helix-turn-helix domain-containing protein [Pyrinomonadaceae bacterium]
MAGEIRHLYEFDRFTLDASERLLLREGRPVRLTPKEFETLLALVRGAGRVIRKEELLKEIWPDTFVGEATLAQNVFTLRKALGEPEGGGAFVETVPRRGYRFAVEVRERREGQKESHALSAARVEDEGRAVVNAAAVSVHDTAAPHFPSPEKEPSDGHVPTASLSSTDTPTAPPQPSGGHPARAAVLIAAAVFAAVAGLVYVIYRTSVRPDVERARTPAPAAFPTMKLTRLPVSGAVGEAVISPDGNYLAYVADEPGRQGQGVWVRQVSAASNTQQVVAPAEGASYAALVFSPDSQHLYYGVRQEGAQPPALFRIPALGGPAVKVLDDISAGPAALSADGRRLAYLRGEFGRELSLYVADSDGANARAVVTRKSPDALGLPAWSPDGETVACAYASLDALNGSSPAIGVTTFKVSDGAERRLTETRWVDVRQLSWLPDGAGLVLSATEAELSPAQIWTLSLSDGEVRRVTNDLNTYLGASVTADGSALVTVQTDRVPNVWVAPAGDAARARQITTGSGKFDGYYGLSWTPDGRIVYASMAGGGWDIWSMNADGTGQRQLTVGARSNYGPSVSADGRYVVFVSNRAGGPFNIWRMDADGGNPLRLTSGRGENFPHVTPDGRWVVYATYGGGQDSAVWKVPIEGGESVRLTSRPASWPFVSPDGKSFVCTYGEGPFSANRLAVIPIEGGEPTRLYEVAPTFRANTVWLPDNRGIAYLDARTGTTNVWMQPLAGGRPVQLTNFAADNVASFDWSRDNRLVATRSVETTSVVLIKDFR